MAYRLAVYFTMTTTTTTKNFDFDLVVTKCSRVDWYPFGFRVDKLWWLNNRARGKFLLRSGKVLFKVGVYDDHIDVDLLNDVGGRKADAFFANNFPLGRLRKRLVASRRRYGFSLGDINHLCDLVRAFLLTLK